jgi:hypothetical protein
MYRNLIAPSSPAPLGLDLPSGSIMPRGETPRLRRGPFDEFRGQAHP